MTSRRDRQAEQTRREILDAAGIAAIAARIPSNDDPAELAGISACTTGSVIRLVIASR